MDCETYLISCQISKVVEAIGHPTGWEIAGVVISGLAAAGTIGIAFANLKLIRSQHAMQKADRAREEKIRRIEFGTALREFFNLVLRQKKDSPYDELAAQFQTVSMLGARTGEPNAEGLRDYVHQRSSSAREPHKGMRMALPAIRDCFDLISRWEQDPESAAFSSKDAWADHLRMVENVVQTIEGDKAKHQELLDSLFSESESSEGPAQSQPLK